MVKNHPNPFFSRKFQKNYRKRISPHPHLLKQFNRRFNLFLNNPHHPSLKDHLLKGSKQGYRAFSVTGDIRVIYEPRQQNTVIFLDVGTHNQVYR